MANITSTETALSERIPCANPKCQKMYDRPFEIFDGNLVCPHCGQIIAASKFKITRHNDNLTRTGQMYFGEYLTNAGISEASRSHNDLPKREFDLRRTLLINASEAFTEAAHLGHPEATIMLGYFCENGYIGQTSRIECYKMAYRYYNSVCESSPDTLEVVDEVGGYSVANRKQFTETQRKAAEYLLNMLTRTPEELDMLKVGSEYPYSLLNNQKRLRELNLVEVGRNFTKASSMNISSGITNLRRTLKAVKEEDRAPVFGYFAITPGELIELLEDKKSSPLRHFTRNATSKVGTAHYAFRSADAYGTWEFREITSLDNKITVGDGVEKVYLCFVNTKPKYNEVFYTYNASYKKTANAIKKLKGSFSEKRGQLYKKLVSKSGGKNGFMNLIDAAEGFSEQSFYLEDIFYAQKKSEKENPIETLIHRIAGG